MELKEIQNKIEEDFGKFFGQMHREEILFAEKGKEKLRFVIYRTKGDKDFPLKKAAFMILDYGLVWNKDDKTALDDDEFIVGCFKTADDIPLPIMAVELSMHIGMYDHMNADLFPISQLVFISPHETSLFTGPPPLATLFLEAVHSLFGCLFGNPVYHLLASSWTRKEFIQNRIKQEAIWALCIWG